MMEKRNMEMDMSGVSESGLSSPSGGDCSSSPSVPPVKRRKSEMVVTATGKEDDVMLVTTPTTSYQCNSSSSAGRSDIGVMGSTERVNPFEAFCLRNLKSSILSPSVFLTSTPTATTPKVFPGWSINEMAELFPKSLEDSPSSHTNPYPVNELQEAQAQQDITEFFNSGPIAPTPDDIVRNPPKNLLGLTPPGRRRRQSCVTSCMNSWTNTVLSLPPGDLPEHVEAALKPYFNMVDSCSETISKSLIDNNEQLWDFEVDESSQTSSKSFRSFQMPARRRLDLSFADMENSPPPRHPIEDPLGPSRQLSSPLRNKNSDESFCTPDSVNVFKSAYGGAGRREFCTPTSPGDDLDDDSVGADGWRRRRSILSSPDITPIRGAYEK